VLLIKELKLSYGLEYAGRAPAAGREQQGSDCPVSWYEWVSTAVTNRNEIESANSIIN